MKNTLRVETPFGTFTRTTAHQYTYVVVTCGCNNAALEVKIREAEARYAKRPTVELDSYIKYLTSRLTQSQEKQKTNQGTAHTWSHSFTNAQKAARSAESSQLLRVVGVYPVPASTSAQEVR